MRILVTGGAGFIASHLVDRLVTEGHRVSVVDDLSTGSEENLNPSAEFFKADIRDFSAVQEVFQRCRPEMVSHHAAHVNVSRAVADPMRDASVNVLGTVNLLQLSAERACAGFIFISSGGAIYGDPKKLPVAESHPPRPLSPYGVSKCCGECYVEYYRRSRGLKGAILRYPNVYGPRQNPHGKAGVVAIFTLAMLAGKRPTIFGDGTKTRDYVYVEDIIEANMAAMFRADAEGCFNLGSGIETSDRQVFETVREMTGADVEPIHCDFRPGEVHRISLDSALAARGLAGWRARTSFREGVRRSVEFYRNQVSRAS